MAADAFAVMREGMMGKVGIGKLALYDREYLVAVKPHERGIVSLDAVSATKKEAGEGRDARPVAKRKRA
jgi:non-homologous end joining protein Ku